MAMTLVQEFYHGFFTVLNCMKFHNLYVDILVDYILDDAPNGANIPDLLEYVMNGDEGGCLDMWLMAVDGERVIRFVDIQHDDYTGQEYGVWLKLDPKSVLQDNPKGDTV